jgi:hypothetical protein
MIHDGPLPEGSGHPKDHERGAAAAHPGTAHRGTI